MTDLPAYNDAAEIERRAKLAQQSALSVDKPAGPKQQQHRKGIRFRHMRTKRQTRRRWNPKRPEFL